MTKETTDWKRVKDDAEGIALFEESQDYISIEDLSRLPDRWKARLTEENRRRLPAPPIIEQMAVANYHRIALQESTNPEVVYGPQFVSVGEYEVRLPRDVDIVVADHIYQILIESGRGFRYMHTPPEPGAKPVERTSSRDDVRFFPVGSPLSPAQAQAHREKGDVPVFPARLTAKAKALVDALSVPQDTKKGR